MAVMAWGFAPAVSRKEMSGGVERRAAWWSGLQPAEL